MKGKHLLKTQMTIFFLKIIDFYRFWPADHEYVHGLLFWTSFSLKIMVKTKWTPKTAHLWPHWWWFYLFPLLKTFHCTVWRNSKIESLLHNHWSEISYHLYNYVILKVNFVRGGWTCPWWWSDLPRGGASPTPMSWVYFELSGPKKCHFLI